MTVPATSGGVDTRRAGGLARTFQSLRHRDYRLYWLGQLVSNTGNWLTNLALTLLILHLTNSGLAIGVLTACQYGPILVLSAWAGVLTDRTDKRRLLLITQAAEMAQSVSLGVLAFVPRPPLVGLFVAAAAGGIMQAIDNPARKVFINDLVPSEDLPNAVVLYSAVNTTAQIFGPALAGLLVVTVGYAWCFLIDAASYLLVMLALAVIRPAFGRRVPAGSPGRGQLRVGLRHVMEEPTLRIVFVIMLVAGMFAYRWNITLPLLAEHALRASDGQFTLLFATFSLGALVGALVAARVGQPTLARTVAWTFVLSVTLTLLAASPNLASAYPAVFVVGIASISCLTSINALVQMNTDPSVVGRVLSLQAVVLLGTTPVGGVLLGYVADKIGARAPVGVGAVAALVAGVLSWLMLRRARGSGDVGARVDDDGFGRALLPATEEPPT